MGNNRKPFEPDTVFHVYNHGNANDQIFKEDKNYNFFLKKYREYIPSVADTYAYCLMPNHFHLMVRVKKQRKLKAFYKKKYPEEDPQSFGNFADLVSNQFKNFLISYAKSFNKMYNRRGSLFLDNLNRTPVKNDTYFTQLIRYIHRNPVKHGFVAKITNWPYSSFRSLLSKKPTSLERKKVLNWFGGREEFIRLHRQI